MRVYCWNSSEKKFFLGPAQDYVPAGDRVVLHSLQVGKGEQVTSEGVSGERMICLLRGSWRMKIADNQLVVRRNEAVIIPPGFDHSAVAIEDSFAVQMAPDRER